MENYRDTLKIQNLVIGIASILLAAFCFFTAGAESGLFPVLNPVAGDSHWQSMWRGFCCGVSFGILALLIYGLLRNIKALNDEEYLKKLYIKEHDERTIQIWTSARAAALQVFILLGLVAALIAGYFSMTASITLIVSVFSASILGLFFKIYFSIKL